MMCLNASIVNRVWAIVKMSNIISLAVPLERMVVTLSVLHKRMVDHCIRCKRNFYLSNILDGFPTAVHVQYMMLSS